MPVLAHEAVITALISYMIYDSWMHAATVMRSVFRSKTFPRPDSRAVHVAFDRLNVIANERMCEFFYWISVSAGLLAIRVYCPAIFKDVLYNIIMTSLIGVKFYKAMHAFGMSMLLYVFINNPGLVLGKKDVECVVPSAPMASSSDCGNTESDSESDDESDDDESDDDESSGEAGSSTDVVEDPIDTIPEQTDE